MKSLEILEEFNKILIEADKQCNIVSESVGEQDRIRSDMEHDLLNDYKMMSAKEKRRFADEFFDCLVERHKCKYRYRELEILKELYNLQGLKNAFNETINKLRKLNQEIESPIYHKRAKKNEGEIVVVNKILKEEKWER